MRHRLSPTALAQDLIKAQRGAVYLGDLLGPLRL
jgi:hypothetical protein